MDLLGAWSEKIRFYSVRRAKTNINAAGEHCDCGLAFPSKMWKKTGNWKFYCSCDWKVLEEEGKKDPDTSNPVTV
eukprot:2343508-Prorocentrum_lima.AAC.1